MLIRRVLHTDIPTIVRLGEQFIASSPQYRGVPFEASETTALLEWFVDHPDRLAIVAEDCDDIIGFFLGYITTFAFSRALLALDTALFVVPERRGGVGRRLVSTYVEWALDRTPHVRLSETAGIAPEAYRRLAERCGFVPCGNNYQHAAPLRGITP